ncbi:MAG: C40 family peptidase, partial [Lachnospiraceae bacterium]|nr:C40 family peptidase [Lachnospiraceae bacterium]
SRQEEEARRQAEEAARQEEARRQAEEAARQEEEARRQAEEAARQEEARRQAEEAARQAEEAARQAEEARRQAEEAERQAREAAQNAQQSALDIARAEAAGTLGRAIADRAASFVGWLPYIWGGASLETGADCSGFVGQIMASFGLLDQTYANYHGYCSYNFPYLGYEVPLDQIQPGDVVCYKGHVAIYFGNQMIVHEPNINRFCEYGSLYVLPIISVRRLY